MNGFLCEVIILNVHPWYIIFGLGILIPIALLVWTKGGLRTKIKVKKCDLISSHTARRTSCTLMYLAGVQVIDIMKVSGHKSEREFLKYIRVSKEETAINLSNHPYFLGHPLKVVKSGA